MTVDSVFYNNYLIIILALINGGADVNMANEKFITALIAGVRLRLHAIALALINGADVNMADKEAETALMNTVRFGPKEITLALINGGADVNIDNNYI